MRLFYSRDPVGNFGDDLNPWLWSRLLPGLIDDDEETLFVGIGTILNSASGRTIPDEPLKVVFGAGAGYGAPPTLDDKWKVYCVRGPLTARKLGISASLAITDPAILVRTLQDIQISTMFRPAFMPHHGTRLRIEAEGIDLGEMCSAMDIGFIDPCADVETVLSGIGRTSLLLTEAMHGAIVADALRIPWKPVTIYDHILPFKWQDWCLSVGLSYQPFSIPLLGSADPEQALIRGLYECKTNHRPHLSSDERVESLTQALQCKLEDLKAEFYKPGHSMPKMTFQPREQEYGNSSSECARMPDIIQQEYRRWWHEYQLAAKYISKNIGPSDLCIFVDNGAYLDEFSGSKQIIPFTRRNGVYWGPPENSAKAVAEVEQRRHEGATHIVIAKPGLWMLEHWAGFSSYLETHYQCLLRKDYLVVFDLRVTLNSENKITTYHGS